MRKGLRAGICFFLVLIVAIRIYTNFEFSKVVAETFLSPVNVDNFDFISPFGADSPAITLHEDGSLYAVWHDGRREQQTGDTRLDNLFFGRSQDGGATWSEPVQIVSDAFSLNDGLFQPSIAVCNDRIVVTWSGLYTYATYSTDHGATWSEPVRINPVNNNHQYNTKLATDSNCTFHVVFTEYEPEKGYRIRYSNSITGETWTTPIKISSYIGYGGKQTLPAISIDSETNEMHIVWDDSRQDGVNYDIFYSSSTDGGQTWTLDERINEELVNVSHDLPSIAVGKLKTGEHRIYVAWDDDRDGDGKEDPFVSWKTQDGWVEPVRVTQSGFGTADTGVKLNLVKGTLVASWIHDWYGVSTIRLAGTNDGTTWKGETIADTENSGDAIMYIDTVTSKNGKTLILEWKHITNDADHIFSVSGSIKPNL